MIDGTVTGMQESADIVFAELDMLSESLKETRERLCSPIDYKGAVSIIEAFGSAKQLQRAKERMYGAECIENSRRCRAVLDFTENETLPGRIVGKLDNLFIKMGELLTDCIKETLENATNDVESFNNIRKDIYRLVAVSNMWYDSMPLMVSNFSDVIPAETDTGDYLIDNDLVGTAQKAIQRTVSTCGGSFVDIDSVEPEIARWKNRFSLLISAARAFIKETNAQ